MKEKGIKRELWIIAAALLLANLPLWAGGVAQGLRFDRFYSAHPSCSPTRGSVITGRHPNRYGTFAPGWSIRPEEITFAQILRKRLRNGSLLTAISAMLFLMTANIWESPNRQPAKQSDRNGIALELAAAWFGKT